MNIRRRLPIGIRTFREIREKGCYYVDKTAYVEQLAEEGKHYFLSRPQRFGKNLFLDTLKEFFEGNEPRWRSPDGGALRRAGTAAIAGPRSATGVQAMRRGGLPNTGSPCSWVGSRALRASSPR